MSKEKYELEYLINASKQIIYTRISTPSGLADWFSDDVHIRGDIFTFIWEGSEEKAKLVTKKKEEFVKFKWVDEDPKYYFEMRIHIDDLTGELALLITDFAEPDDIEDSTMLWDSQIEELRHILGC